LPDQLTRQTFAETETQITELAAHFDRLRQAVREVIIGHDRLLDALVMAFLCRGHILIEGVPGLAKTLTATTLAAALDLSFKRVQFTPDLLPSDLVGTPIYHPASGQFRTRKGPIFANMVLADEINRAPAKVQSALLEAMQEQQVTLGEETHALPNPFLVMATQNPLEHEGTYPLPEAQIDRFLFKALVGYPSREDEALIVDRISIREPKPPAATLSIQEMMAAQEIVGRIHLDDRIRDYLLDIIAATRDPAAYGLDELASLIDHGVSPRGSIFLARAARARAFLQQRAYVVPDDILTVAPLVLRHRLLLSYEADVEGAAADELLQRIFDVIPAP